MHAPKKTKPLVNTRSLNNHAKQTSLHKSAKIMQQFLTMVVGNPKVEMKHNFVQLIDAIVTSQHRVMRIATSVQFTTVAMEDVMEDVVNDKIVEGTIVPTCPMVMATMAAVVEGTTMAMTVITTISIMLTMTNIIVPQVVLAHDLITQAEIGAQVVHAVKAMNALHPLIIIMWSLATHERSMHSKLMRRTNARCQQKQHLAKHLATRMNARALTRPLTRPQSGQLNLLVKW